jgi:hypothetical protein
VPIDIADSIELMYWPEQSLKYVRPRIQSMQGSDEIESRLREMIHDLDNEDASHDLEAILDAIAKRDQRISETLEELLKEVDELILLADDLEEGEQCAQVRTFERSA